jgi:hypothetical protein
MATSTHTQTATGGVVTGVSGDSDSGVIAHGGTISSSRWTNKDIISLVAGADSYGSLVFDSTWVDKTVSSQDLAYNPSGHAVSRTKANSGFLARGVQTLIGGKAATADILNVLGSDGTSRPAGNIHSTESNYQYGTWADTILDIFGTGALSGTRTGKGTKSTYINPVGGGASADSAAAASRAIPGEFAVLINFVNFDGASVSGDGTGVENLMDYSAVTGG